MPTPKSIPKDIDAIVANVLKHSPFPANVDSLDAATRRTVERLATMEGATPQQVLDAARAEAGPTDEPKESATPAIIAILDAAEDRLSQIESASAFDPVAIAAAARAIH